MTWINALGSAGWAMLLAIPPMIVLLYFLKLRRQPLEVPSTLLWRKTMEDMHVNSLWQRLRTSLLLFLQLLVVLLLILACLRPGCRGTELVGGRFIFLLDHSASMSATDLGSGTRLDEAKRQIGIMIDRMKPGDAAMLITFSDQSEVVQSFTTNRNLLKQKLSTVEPSERGTNLREALVAASGLANPGRTATDAGDFQVAEAQPAQLFIFSDGGFPNVDDFNLGNLIPEYRAIGGVEPPTNLGITAFAMDSDGGPGGQREVFAQIANASPSEQEVAANLYVNDRLFDAQSGIRIPPGRSAGLSFPLTGLFQNLRAATRLRLELEVNDELTLDNRAFAVVNPPRLARVLVFTPGNDYLKIAMATEPVQQMAEVRFVGREALSDPELTRDAALGEYDLIVYDQCSPEVMPNGNTWFLGNRPPGEIWSLGPRQFPTPIVDFRKTHPLMSSLQMNGVSILEASPISGPQDMLTLLETTYGSVMAIAPRGGYQDLIVSFPLATWTGENLEVNTDWPSRLSFPLFVQNVISQLAGGARFLTAENIAPGQLARLRPPAAVSQVSIEGPAGQPISLSRDASDEFIFSQTDRIGIYTVDATEFSSSEPPPRQLFAVNLFDPQETEIPVREQLEIGYEPIPATTDVQEARLEFWRWGVVVALVVLMIEWYIYNRRILI